MTRDWLTSVKRALQQQANDEQLAISKAQEQLTSNIMALQRTIGKLELCEALLLRMAIPDEAINADGKLQDSNRLAK